MDASNQFVGLGLAQPSVAIPKAKHERLSSFYIYISLGVKRCGFRRRVA